MWTLVDRDLQNLGEEHHGGSTQTASMVAGDAAVEVDGASSFVRSRPHIEHDTGPVETNDLQGADQTKPVANINVFDEAPVSVAESSRQIPAPMTVSSQFSAPIKSRSGCGWVYTTTFRASLVVCWSRKASTNF